MTQGTGAGITPFPHMTLPSNLDAERHFLGCLIRDGATFPEGIMPSDFFEPKHQEIATTLLDLSAQGITPDEVTVTTALRDAGAVADHITVNDMTTVVGFSAANPAWAEQVVITARLRRIASVNLRIQKAVADGNADPDSLLAYAEGEFKSIAGISKRKDGPARMPIANLLSFDRKADPYNLIGNRWLCRGSSLVLAGQAGTGKSALLMQACLSWTLGKDFFGIKVERPLRSLVIQAENDLGDMSESFQDICNGLGFDSAERGLIADNLAIFRESVATGPEFGKVLRRLITEHRADIVFVDPLMAYSGCDLSETSEASAFLRHVIQPILDETGVIIVFMHHTGKPKSKADSEGQTTADLAYQMFGSSEITNWAREVATLVRCQGDEPIYRLALTKRRGRAGLTDINSQPSGQIYIRHSPKQGEIRWVRSFAPTPPPKDSDYSPAKGSPRRSDY